MVSYEGQVRENQGSFTVVVTTTTESDLWVSAPVPLNATTWDEAKKEATEKIRVLRGGATTTVVETSANGERAAKNRAARAMAALGQDGPE